MSRWLFAALAIAPLAIASPALAQCRRDRDHSGFPGLRQGEIHNPFSRRYHPLLPNTYRAARFDGFCGPRFSSRCGRCGGCGGCSCFGGVAFLPIGWPWTYNSSFFGWYTPYSSGYWFYGPAVSVIFVADANAAGFGPGAANRFAGAALANSAPARQANAFGETRVARAAALAANAAREKSGRLLAAGDAFFREQKFDAALLRYRKAATTAPNEAAPLVRRAMVHVAQQRYDLAAKSFRRALEIEPGLDRADLGLNELYGNQIALQRRHCQELIAAASARPREGDVALAAGAALLLSHRGADARKWLERAADEPADRPLLASLLDRAAPGPALDASRLALRQNPPNPAAAPTTTAPSGELPPGVTTLSQRLDP